MGLGNWPKAIALLKLIYENRKEKDQGAHIYLDSQARSASLLYTFMPHLLPTPSLPPNLPLDPASQRERGNERAERGRAEREEEETQQYGKGESGMRTTVAWVGKKAARTNLICSN